MTPISPQDRNKAIILVLAVVAVFGFLFWRIFGSSGSTSEAPPPTVNLSTPTPGSTPPAVPAQVVEVAIPSTAALVNPFRTVLRPAGVAAAAPTGNRVRPAGPGLGQGTFPPVNPGDVPAGMSVEPNLIGVVTGANPVAIFKVGDREVVLHRGEKLDTGEVLDSVTNDSATLRKGGKKTVLRVGTG